MINRFVHFESNVSTSTVYRLEIWNHMANRSLAPPLSSHTTSFVYSQSCQITGQRRLAFIQLLEIQRSTSLCHKSVWKPAYWRSRCITTTAWCQRTSVWVTPTTCWISLEICHSRKNWPLSVFGRVSLPR